MAALDRVRAAAFAQVFASFRQIVGPRIAGLGLATAEAEQAELLATMCSAETPDMVFVAVDAQAIDQDARGGEPVGFVVCSLHPDAVTGEIGLLGVHPDHRGRGIGAALCARALEALRARGAALAVVGAGDDPSHAAARRVYEKAGFTVGLPSMHLYQAL